MNEFVRPLRLGEILDRAVQLYRARFLVYLGLAIVPNAVLLFSWTGSILFLSWVSDKGEAPLAPATVGILALVYLAVLALFVAPAGLLAASFSSAALSHAAERAWRGERSTIAGSFTSVWKNGWRYVVLKLLLSVFLFWAPVVLLTAAEAPLLIRWGPDVGARIALVGTALFCVYFLWMRLRLTLAFSACVTERMGPWKAIRRGIRLSRRARGRLFLLHLLPTVLAWVLTVGFALPMMIVVALIPLLNTPRYAHKTGMLVLALIAGAYYAAQTLIRPVTALAQTLTYYDQRIRLEGFDIEWMMQRAGLAVEPTPNENARLPHQSPPQPLQAVPGESA